MRQPKRSVVTATGHKISITPSGQISLTSEQAIRAENDFSAVDDLLYELGITNRYILFIVLSMGLFWGLGIMSVMCSVFYEAGFTCDHYDYNCEKERYRINTIEDQFHIHDGSFLSVDWSASIFFAGDLVGGILLSYLSDM
uniref:Transmembrane protein n=1 Tax=Bursaphelenchus xylophilus TaxID=6326 RepID=A0A1I7SIN8_BURXY